MDSKLATAFFLSPHRVFGYRLKPFCLLHSLQLEAIHSPLVSGGEVKPHDVLVAAQICSDYNVRTRYRRHRWRRFWANAEKEEAKLDAYLAESKSRPDLQDAAEDSGGRGCLRAPWQLVIVTSLIRNTSLTWRQAWTMPEGQAIWLFYSIREQLAGKSDIYSEEEQLEDAAMRAEQEANAELHAQRLADFEEYLRRRREGTWPKGLVFSHLSPMPPEDIDNG